jgi:hypothetical protein
VFPPPVLDCIPPYSTGISRQVAAAVASAVAAARQQQPSATLLVPSATLLNAHALPLPLALRPPGTETGAVQNVLSGVFCTVPLLRAFLLLCLVGGLSARRASPEGFSSLLCLVRWLSARRASPEGFSSSVPR